MARPAVSRGELHPGDVEIGDELDDELDDEMDDEDRHPEGPG